MKEEIRKGVFVELQTLMMLPIDWLWKIL